MNKILFLGRKHKFSIIAAIIIILAAGWGYSKFSAKNNQPTNQAVPVTVEKAQQHTETVQLTAVGKVFPYSTVSVRSQVEGPIVKIDFERGDDVIAGQILFTIDPRPYEVALQVAEANLAKEQALLVDAQSDLKRMEGLVSKKFISQENYDQVYSTMKAQEAGVHAAEANVADAQLKLDYCTIRSPIDGKTGDILIHLGNLVKANDTQALVVINQLKPIFVSFDVPEKFLPPINKRMAQGKVAVTVRDVDGNILSDQGELFFVDNTIDTLTGTIELKANFPNEQDELWPGQFANVELGLYTVDNAILIPTRAIQHGQKGSYVYVIDAGDKAEYRTIQIGESVGSNTIVTEGVDVNEQLVVNGQFRLVDGTAVQVTTASPQ
jgi:multidrug efflux system membrane fusion protein